MSFWSWKHVVYVVKPGCKSQDLSHFWCETTGSVLAKPIKDAVVQIFQQPGWGKFWETLSKPLQVIRTCVSHRVQISFFFSSERIYWHLPEYEQSLTKYHDCKCRLCSFRTSPSCYKVAKSVKSSVVLPPHSLSGVSVMLTGMYSITLLFSQRTHNSLTWLLPWSGQVF